MANYSFSNRVYLLVILVVLEFAVIAFGAREVSFTIVNQIVQEPSAVQVDCWYKNREIAIPERTLRTLEYVQFGGFTPNFWGTTWFNCYFTWGARTAAFEVWIDRFWPKKRPCSLCSWTVRADGFTEYDASPGGGLPVVAHYNWN
ncbi:hypothetical protein KC19_7G142500 [Ceratodon purpureus]|uniref:S-protein homolog n=1 Tax=Ceratodon purpureus TaxID=3225 RepID=A0A8T0H6G9_CERPU|nr:hypothetical protein KC19_7G142500 [Ceratodon purpureus]